VITPCPHDLRVADGTHPIVLFTFRYGGQSTAGLVPMLMPVFTITSSGLQRHQEPLSGWAAALIATSQH